MSVLIGRQIELRKRGRSGDFAPMNPSPLALPLNRVPHIIFIYWVIKMASTTLGETGSDMFAHTYELGYVVTTLIFVSLFLVLLGIKLALKKYEPITYWLVFTSTAILGTAVSDLIDRTLGLGYPVGSALLLSILVVILIVWKKVEKSIAVEHIRTTKAEVFYWLAFLVANTLGTAAGDYLSAETEEGGLELGFMNSALIIAGILLVLVVLHYTTKISKVVLFWLAFVLTRPFGATFGDFLTKSKDQGGLDLGTVGSSVFFAIILVVAVLIEARYEKRRNATAA